MAVIQVISRIWQRDFICITNWKENQGVIRPFFSMWPWTKYASSIITRGSSMKGMGFPSKIPMFDAMRVTKEVHSIVPIILKFVSHCLTIALAGETQILLTMTYNVINSSLHTVRGSSLGKRVMATNLCIKRRVRFWMSLHQGANLAWTTWQEIEPQNSCRSKPRQAFSRETGKRALKPRKWLKFL